MRLAPVGTALVSLGLLLGGGLLPHPTTAQEIVALRIDAGRPYDDSIETRFSRCIADAFPAPAALGRDAPSAALRDALFPWFDAGVAPRSTEEFAALLGTRLVSARLNSLGVRYLLILSAQVADVKSTDDLYAIPSMGWLGAAKTEQGYSLSASLWDVRSRSVIARGQGNWSHSVGMVGIGLPIPFFYSTESRACDEILRFLRQAMAAGR